MSYKDERKVFAKLMRYTSSELLSQFTVNKDEGCIFFAEKKDQNHFIAVSIDRKDGLAPVNADFGFSRPAASNNYPELLELGKRFIGAFGLKVNW